MNREICKLCKEEKELQESHIVPKSIYRWLKNTSGSTNSFLRGTSNINLRVQDGIKIRLLCRDCEQKFGQYEKYFVEEIFKPINDSKFPVNIPKGFNYSEKLTYFINSIWWRIIQVNLTNQEIRTSEFWCQIQEYEEDLRNFLLHPLYKKKFNNNYIFTTGYVDSGPSDYNRINHFYMRSVDPAITFYDSSCFLCLRIPSFMFFGNIFGLENSKLQDLKINPIGGIFKVPKESIIKEPSVSSFISYKLKIYDDAFNKMSNNQKHKIKEDISKNWETFRESKSYMASHLDKLRDSKIKEADNG